MTTLPLASEFPAATREQWLRLVDNVLKGADFDKRLVGRTYDGLSIQPLAARRADAVPVGRIAGAAPWLVAQRVDDPDAARANAQALDDLMGGANALRLVFADSPAAFGFGLKDASRETLTRVLSQIELDMGVTLDLDIGPASKDAGEVIADLARQKGISPGQLDIKFGFNPFAVFAEGGPASAMRWADVAPMLATMVKNVSAAGFRGQSLVCDGRLVHAAGGSDAQELAFVLASAAEYARVLVANGLSLTEAMQALYVRVAVDADQFGSIAKLRALRKLWARFEAACGLVPAPVFVVAETAWRMLTRIDPQVNILRNTVAVFAGAVGGADMISVLPHSAAVGLADGAARRLARNTQVVLAEELNLYRVVDPGAGSGAIEAMTDDLAGRAWAEFQSIELAGGIVPYILSGALKQAVANVAAARLKAVATRRDPLTGASEFPNVAELPVTVLQPAVAAAPLPGLQPMRLAAPFETLRGQADLLPVRPRVFLANLGTVADFTARTIFAKNFYEAGGFEAPTNNGFELTAALIEAAKASGAKIAVICSSDAIYATEAMAVAQALAAAGLAVALAGRPGEAEAAMRAAGVRQFAYVGADVVATLTEAQALAGIA